MELYGYFTWNHHGWAKIMTVLAPDGSDAAFDHIEAGSDFIVKGGDGRLPQYQEKRGQALATSSSRLRSGSPRCCRLRRRADSR